MRIITTERSRWILDEDSMMVTRIPRNENPDHPGLQYTDVGHPQPFVYAHRTFLGGFERLCVHLDAPNRVYEDLHRRAASGEIESDTHPATEIIGEPERCPMETALAFGYE